MGQMVGVFFWEIFLTNMDVTEWRLEITPDDGEKVSNTEDINWESKLLLLLHKAIKDTIYYFAIHFIIYSLASEVIALASANSF